MVVIVVANRQNRFMVGALHVCPVLPTALFIPYFSTSRFFGQKPTQPGEMGCIMGWVARVKTPPRPISLRGPEVYENSISITIPNWYTKLIIAM